MAEHPPVAPKPNAFYESVPANQKDPEVIFSPFLLGEDPRLINHKESSWSLHFVIEQPDEYRTFVFYADPLCVLLYHNCLDYKLLSTICQEQLKQNSPFIS